MSYPLPEIALQRVRVAEIEDHFEQNRLYHYDQGDLKDPERPRPNILRGGRFRHRSRSRFTNETILKSSKFFRGLVKKTSSRGGRKHQTNQKSCRITGLQEKCHGLG